MTVKKIITDYLKNHGYDGLFNFECGCELDDLIPCVAYMDGCEAGYKQPCDCGGGCNWHMGSEKPMPPTNQTAAEAKEAAEYAEFKEWQRLKEKPAI